MLVFHTLYKLTISRIIYGHLDIHIYAYIPYQGIVQYLILHLSTVKSIHVFVYHQSLFLDEIRLA